jgi:hypothetical protein
MRLKIEIEVNEQKDGSFIAKLGDKVLGPVKAVNNCSSYENLREVIDAGSINPEEELDRVYMLQQLWDFNVT